MLTATPSVNENTGRPPLLHRLRARLISRRLIAVYLALAVNALLLGGYFWSKGGATMHVRIVAEGIDGIYTVSVDGKEQVKARCEEYSSGAVIIKMPTDDVAASLPHPRGLDRLVVTRASSGEVVFDANSSQLADSDWVTTADHWRTLNIGDISWSNYVVDAYFKNPTQASIMVHALDQNNGIVYSFRPFRHLDNGLDYRQNGKSAKCPVTWTEGPSKDLGAVGSVAAPGLELSKVETLKSMLAMTLRPYPLVAAALCLMLVAVTLLHLVGLERVLRRLRPPEPLLSPGGLALVTATAAFGVLIYISHNVNQGMPHVPDEVSYVFQAKILASFHLTTPIPSPKDAFSFFYPSLLVESHGHWASIYPLGHPLMLAVGQLVGAIWLIPPILGAFSILLIYAVGRRMHGARVGIVAAALLAFSPFFQMTASNLMSHNTAVFYLLASLFFLTVDWKRRSLAYGLAGVCFGLLLNTRPLTAASLVPPFGLLFLFDLTLDKGQRLATLRRSFAFAGGVLLMVGAFYLYNLGTTDSLSTGYGNNAAIETVVGFGEKNSVARGMQNEQADFASLLVVLNGWPLFVGLALVLLPFMLGSRNRWDVFALLAALFAIGIWTAYEGSGLMHGPRYWYEAIPFLMLLAARGLVLLQERLARWAALILPKADTGAPFATAGLFTYSVLIVLLGMSVHGWMLGKHFETARNDYAPRTISELKGFNGADDRLLRKVDEMGLHDALVLVRACSNWQCYGTVFWKNDTDFDGDIVFARDLPSIRGALVSYLDRKIYLADYGAGTIIPYDPFPLRPDSPGA